MSQQTINTPRDSTLKTTEQTPRNIADVLADELSGIAQALGGSTDYDDLSHRPQINSVTLTGDKSADDLSLAMQEDLTSIKATGTTNATGSTIKSGTFFYLNGTLCKAKSDIANGATFTLNTNYEVVTAGGLNSLNSALEWKQIATNVTSLSHDLSQYKEILIDVGFQGNVNHNTIHIITAELSATTHYYSSGYYRTTNDSIGVKVGVNTSGVTGSLVYVDGNTTAISSTFSVYAR